MERKNTISFYSLLLPIPVSFWFMTVFHFISWFLLSPSSSYWYRILLKAHLAIEIRSTVFFFIILAHRILGQKILPFAEIRPVRHPSLSFMHFQIYGWIIISTNLSVICSGSLCTITNDQPWLIDVQEYSVQYEFFLPLSMSVKIWPDFYSCRNKGKPERTNRQSVDGNHFCVY